VISDEFYSMKFKRLPLFLAAPLFVSHFAFADAGKFGYARMETNGILATLVDVYYEKDGIKYPITNTPEPGDQEGAKCAAFGFTSDLGLNNDGVSMVARTATTTLIDWNAGKLGTPTGDYQIKDIFCVLPASSAPSTDSASRVENADGTVTINEPRFNYEGHEAAYDPSAGVEGVCQIYGLRSIDRDAKSEYFTTAYYNPEVPAYFLWFDAFDGVRYQGKLYHQSSMGTTNSQSHRISSVTCKK
jgi:hypothetical protein